MILPVKIKVIVTLIAIGFLAYVSRLILKRRLKEEYAIIWFVSTFILALLSFRSDLLDTVAVLLGVAFAPNLLFAGIIFVGMVYLLHLSVKLSKQQEQTKNLTQEIALLKQAILENKVNSLGPDKIEE
ncbi:MAG: DUF2304 domain-containing protein [Sphingobacteriales bacterium JAD_PAG50586_3]|nr:MAG: DUF2304 domain-containing protein [Sphingobacteriales bacterium JAD_PAG50586_3]